MTAEVTGADTSAIVNTAASKEVSYRYLEGGGSLTEGVGGGAWRPGDNGCRYVFLRSFTYVRKQIAQKAK